MATDGPEPAETRHRAVSPLRSRVAAAALVGAFMVGPALLPLRIASAGEAERLYQEQLLIDHGIGIRARAVRRAAEASESFEVRMAAMSLLVLRKDRKAIPILQRVLQTADDPYLSSWAALGLARLGNDIGLRAIREELLEMSTGARVLLGRAWDPAVVLAQAGDPAGYPVVLKLLESPEAWQRQAGANAIWAFVRFKELDAVDRLIVAAGDADATVRHFAVVVFPAACKESAPASRLLETLERLEVRDPDPRVRRQARAAATMIRSSDPGQMTCMDEQ